MCIRDRYWTSVRAVELRCESTWRLLPGRSLSGRLLSGQFSSDERPSGQYRAADGLVGARGVDTIAGSSIARSSRAGSSVARAYSSIGQSPRLITGLFLVRTQVGPLALFHCSADLQRPADLQHFQRPADFQRSSSEPFRSTMSSKALFSNTMFPSTTFRSGRRSNTLPIEKAMRRPTSL